MKWLTFVLLTLLVASCQHEIAQEFKFRGELMEVPKGLPTIDFPDDNQFTVARWELGKKLFYDPVMSLDSSISCASCHRADIAFSDDVPISLGIEDRIGTRNVPTLTNVGYQPYYTKEGGVPSLEVQVFIPIEDHNEFGFNMLLLSNRLSQDATYVKLAQNTYGRSPDPFVIVRALATFERSLISGYSRYDQYTNYGKMDALTEVEKRGMNLFFSNKTNCSTCHDGFNFTNYAFENNGLYEVYQDEGRFNLTGLEIDRAKFKVPTLRNIELTAPYMHDGSLNSLEDVLDHYISGGVNHPNKSGMIQSLSLTETEQEELLEFLKSLTDDTFISNPLFSN